MILCSNPLAQYRTHKSEIDEAVSKVLNKGRYILGDEVESFEKEFARFIGVSRGVGVGSGTEALRIALLACGLGKGDEVITVSHTAVATISAIESTGARPVFVDIDPVSYTIDAEKIKRSITKRTRAIVPVHIYGRSADMEPISEIASRYCLRIIEDCAQAHGAKYKGKRVGSWGDISCFSFYPTKNLGAVGDGGMILTDDRKLADRAVLLREYGWKKRYVSQVKGMNSRLDELQAAILRVKLRHLESDNQKRIGLAGIYNKMLAETGLTLPEYYTDFSHVYHLYVVRCRFRDSLMAYLKNNSIHALIHYPVPVHRQKAYAGGLVKPGSLYETECAAREVLSLPMYPELSVKSMKDIIQLIKGFKGGLQR
ncbi:MAG: DegT/DnrJ/EryC1/StrS family aminotransferase [Candidatus Omnitrophota bacterium]|nr:DegT/DnrJ/EryC1/StrS family aminotransferase [Candidatus Omnitrophota bacterium]